MMLLKSLNIKPWQRQREENEVLSIEHKWSETTSLEESKQFQKDQMVFSILENSWAFNPFR